MKRADFKRAVIEFNSICGITMTREQLEAAVDLRIARWQLIQKREAKTPKRKLSPAQRLLRQL